MKAARLRTLACLVLLTSVLLSGAAQAQAPLSLAQLPEQLSLVAQARVLEDPSGTLDGMRAPAASFLPPDGDELSFGFSYEAVWVRFTAHNASSEPVRWILELGEPTLDDVRLYVQHRDGKVDVHETGDARPFSTREVGHGKFVFALENPAQDVATYYLRAQTTGALRLPLFAWQPAAYAAHHERENLGFWLFYGALLVIAGFNLCALALVRDREHLWYAFAALSICAVQMGLNGHISQFVLPDDPGLVNRLLPVSIGTATLAFALFAHAVIARLLSVVAAERNARWLAILAGGLAAFVCFAPVGIGIRLLCVVLVVITTSGPYLQHLLSRFETPELQLYLRSWYALIFAVPIAVLRYAHVLPPWPLTDWALQIGFTLHGLASSVALASWATGMRAKLAALNTQLSDNVADLKKALAHAEEANQEARRATKAKDEFVATMSHELRTPLNAIINIPQGLIDEFVSLPAARCTACHTMFLLDEGELLPADASCENCQRTGTLVEASKVKYRGDELRTVRFLQKIERSGQHLLQMVNGVLDYSKLEAGRFELSLAPVDLEALIREVSDQMVDLAQRRGIQIVVSGGGFEQELLMADVLRLKQVLINLLANAVKFSEPDTTVIIHHTSHADAELIEVRDTGIGIAAADHERIFTSFEQVHKGDTRKYGGTGLGLSISRSLVRMHGGELSVQSELGKGSTFTVRLPRLATSAALVGSPSTEFAAAEPSTKRMSRPRASSAQ